MLEGGIHQPSLEKICFAKKKGGLGMIVALV